MVDPLFKRYGQVPLERVAKSNCRQCGLNEQGMLKRLIEAAHAGALKVVDGKCDPSEAEEAIEKYKPFFTGNAKDIWSLVSGKKPEPEHIIQEPAPKKETVPSHEEAPEPPLAPVIAEIPVAPCSETAAIPLEAPRKAVETSGVDEKRLETLRDQASELAKRHIPNEYVSTQDLMLAVLCDLERSGAIYRGNGNHHDGEVSTPWKGPFFTDMVGSHEEYVIVRSSPEYAEFEALLFNYADKIRSGGGNGGFMQRDFHGFVKGPLHDNETRQRGKVFVTKWTRRMARDMAATDIAQIGGEGSLSTADLRTMTTTMSRIICGIENLDWTAMKVFIRPSRIHHHAPEEKPKRVKKDRECFPTLEEGAKWLRSRLFRADAVLVMLNGLEKDGQISREARGYSREGIKAASDKFREVYCTENEAVGIVAKGLQLCGASAKAKLGEYRKMFSEKELIMRHGLYSRLKLEQKVNSGEGVFSRYASAERAARKEEKANGRKGAVRDPEKTRQNRGKRLLKEAELTLKAMMDTEGKRKSRVDEALGCDSHALFGKALKNLNGMSGVFSPQEFIALSSVEKIDGRILRGAGVSKKDLANLVFVAKAKLARTEEGKPLRT